MTEAAIPAELRSAWHEDGWWVWRTAIPATDLLAAERRSSKLFPSAEEMDAAPTTSAPPSGRIWDAAWPEFPFRSRSLNKLALHPVLMDLAEDLLGTDDIRLYMALITAKYAQPVLAFQPAAPHRLPNHMIVVPRPEAGYQQLETFVYLTDVTADNGATRLVSYRRRLTSPSRRHTLNFTRLPPISTKSPARQPGRRGRSSATGPTSITALGLGGARQAQDHDAPVVQARRRRVGRLSRVALQGPVSRLAQLRP